LPFTVIETFVMLSSRWNLAARPVAFRVAAGALIAGIMVRIAVDCQAFSRSGFAVDRVRVIH
jgi:hypothetical protein